MRGEKEKQLVNLGARLRKPSKAVAEPLGNHEGDIRGRKQVNPLAGSRCGIVQTGKYGQEPAGLH